MSCVEWGGLAPKFPWPLWALLPDRPRPQSLAGAELPCPIPPRFFPGGWGPEGGVLDGDQVFRPWALVDAVLHAWDGRDYADRFVDEETGLPSPEPPPWVFAWNGYQGRGKYGWVMALIGRDAMRERRALRHIGNAPYAETEVVWAPLPELEVLPMIGRLLLEEAGIAADWFEETLNDSATAERLRSRRREPLPEAGPEDEEWH